MKLFNWQIILGISLVILSAVVYFIHYLIFRDTHHIFIYLIGDLAFVFIEVLLVTLIIHRLLSLKEKRSLLENPNLLEHETFTELLWAVFHFTEELSARKDIKNLPDTDLNHLVGDMKRIYSLLVREWLDYMKHLKNNYPYLFSFAMRTNPFDENASLIVK